METLNVDTSGAGLNIEGSSFQEELGPYKSVLNVEVSSFQECFYY